MSEDMIPTDEDGFVPALKHRDREIWQMYLAGVPQKSIGEELGVAQSTISRHIAALRRELASHRIVEIEEMRDLQMERYQFVLQRLLSSFNAARAGSHQKSAHAIALAQVLARIDRISGVEDAGAQNHLHATISLAEILDRPSKALSAPAIDAEVVSVQDSDDIGPAISP